MEKKIARICWNSEGWRFPSGPKGKCTTKKTFESKHGYGHEEWLFDRTRVVNGFHYAFLQPLNLKSNKYVGKTYHLILYTIYERTSYIVGEIKEAICISENEAEDVFGVYKQNNWLDEMKQEIEGVKGKSKGFLKTAPKQIFNVRFKFQDVKVFEEPMDVTIKSKLYKLQSADKVPLTEKAEKNKRGRRKSTEIRVRPPSAGSSFEPSHDIMQNEIWELLESTCSKDYKEVVLESDRIDIKAETHDGKFHFFEIKTLDSKLSIRSALGQLMEYSYWPDVEKAEKLVIVSPAEPTEETKRYLSHIRRIFKMPVVYRCYDRGTKYLSKEY